MRTTLLLAGLAVVAAGALATVGAWAQDAKEPAPPPSGKRIELRPPGDRGPDGTWPAVPAPQANGELPPLSDAGRLAYALLASARRFTDDAIYEGGETPEEVEALRILHREPNGGQAFLLLCRRGTVAGKLWGLCGLWYWDKARFHRQVAAVLRDHAEDEVEVQQGCDSLTESVRRLVHVPQAARDGGTVAVALESRSQTCKEWFDARPDDIRAQYDIAGGGWPCVLRSGGGW